MLDYLTIGTIVNVHGVVGEVKILPTTDDLKRFKKLKSVFLCSSDNAIIKTEPKELKVESCKLQNQMVISKLEGINDRDIANKYRGFELRVKREDAVTLPEDTYYIGDIIGCKVVEENGNVLGVVDDIFPAGGSDVYSITGENGKNIMIPAIAEVIRNVDIVNQVVTVKLLPGLKEVYFD